MTVPSYPAPGYQGPVPRSRPTTVTVASYLLFLIAGLQVINAIAAFATVGTATAAMREIYAGTELDGAEGIIAFTYIAGGVINLLLAAGFVILSIFNLRGRNASRIVTWVIGGLSLCCLGLGLGGNALTGSLNPGGTAGAGLSQAEVQQRLNEALPSWYNPVSITITVIVLLAVLATVILLALPPSNEYFRKAAPAAWDPSLPYPAYPPYPGQSYPGQPSSGQAYPGQPSSGQAYPGQPSSGQAYPGQPSSGQSYPGQPYPGQPYPGQPYPGQPYPGQPYPGQPYPGQPYPAQPGGFDQQGQPGQPAPGLPPYPGQPGSGPPPYPEQPAGYGQPGQPASDFPPYPGQTAQDPPPYPAQTSPPPAASPPPAGPEASPQATDPSAPPAPPPATDGETPKPPTNSY